MYTMGLKVFVTFVTMQRGEKILNDKVGFIVDVQKLELELD